MNENKICYKTYIKTAIIFIITFILSVFIFAVAIYYLEDGYKFSPLLATISLAIGGFTSSYYLGYCKSENGIILGVSIGTIIFMITALITLFVNSGSISINLLLRFIIIMLACIIGAIVGVNKKVNKKFI